MPPGSARRRLARMSRRADLDGRVVLVTGAARGIGRELSFMLAARGARLALVGLHGETVRELAFELGPNAAGFEADVADLEAVSAAVEAAVDRFGAIDVVVANAGVAPSTHTMLSMDDAEFRRVIDVDLLGVWHTVKATLPQIAERRGHTLIVSSIYSCMNGMLAAPYAASKAAVEQLGRALRVELAPHGATAGVAYLGFFDTDMVHGAFESDAVARARTAVPAWFTRPLSPAVAADAVVHGIERRSARVAAPRWLPLFIALRGITGPLDAYLAWNPRVREAIGIAEAPALTPRVETRSFTPAHGTHGWERK
jgi:NAD(P)-dependent dehydrogenase (short-subunit alcohol dehydrogenase family)